MNCRRKSPNYTKRAMIKTIYPDVTEILARKKEGRREISRRSLGEKIAMVEAMRERLAPLKRIREETCKSEIRRGEPVQEGRSELILIRLGGLPVVAPACAF